MDKKIRGLLVSLGIIALLAVVIAAGIYFSAQTTVSEYEQKNSQLQKESAQLQESLDTSQKELTRWRDRSQEITANLNKVSEEFLLLQNQHNLLLKEKAALRDKNQALNRQMEDLNKLYLQTKKQAEDTSAQELLKQKEALEKEVEALKSGMMPSFAEEEQDEESLNAQLWKEKTTRAALEDKLFQSERKLRALTEEKNKLSAQLTKMKKALEQRLSQFSQSEQVLQSALADAEKIMQDEDAFSIQLPPIVVKADTVLSGEAAEEELFLRTVEDKIFEYSGNIIKVLDKYKFVVINIGKQEGIEEGMDFTVYRKGEAIGRIEVMETRPHISACDIVEVTAQAGQFKLDDVVRR